MKFLRIADMLINASNIKTVAQTGQQIHIDIGIEVEIVKVYGNKAAACKEFNRIVRELTNELS